MGRMGLSGSAEVSAVQLPVRLVSKDDQTLIDGCIRGDERAWHEFVDRFSRLVYSVPRRLGLSSDDCDDVFQIVFGIVLRRLETLKEAERIAGWLLQTTYREAWRVAKRRRTQAALDEHLVGQEEPTDAELLKLERQHVVRQALTEIDEKCRDLLTAIFLDSESPSYEQIAERMGMRIGSIGPTRARCLQKLEAVLKRLGM